MSTDEAREHLDLAHEKLLVARELAEAEHWRDAASRAYYGMYHAAYGALRTRGHAPRTHRGLASLVGQEFVRSGELDPQRFDALRKAQEVREMGDYGGTFALSGDDVERLVQEAADFVEAVEQLL